LRSGEANGAANTNTITKGDKEKGVNVQVILRCR
jgi:kinesin family protein 11